MSLINQIDENFFSCYSQKSNAKIGTFDFTTDVFTLAQEDVFSTCYLFNMPMNSNILNCHFFADNAWHDANKADGFYSVLLDFENRIETIRIIFTDRIIDDYTFTIKYVEADKQAYYAQEEKKKAQEEKKKKLALRKAADIRCATGADLVNIYFQPCCDNYEYTEILLFIPKEKIHRGWTSNGREIVEIPSWMLIKKCKVAVDDFFKSIGGLAIGTYSFVLKQYGKNEEVLLETEHIEFSIKAPKQPCTGQVNVI